MLRVRRTLLNTRAGKLGEYRSGRIGIKWKSLESGFLKKETIGQSNAKEN
jgi:hypothetical protein